MFDYISKASNYQCQVSCTAKETSVENSTSEGQPPGSQAQPYLLGGF